MRLKLKIKYKNFILLFLPSRLVVVPGGGHEDVESHEGLGAASSQI